jgi:hypothetical protein
MPLYSTACPIPINRKIFRHRVSSSPFPEPFAYWKLDNTSWLDSSGNGYALSYESSNPTIGTGIINGDATFDTTNGLYNYGISQQSTLSLSCWVKPTTIATGGYQALIGNWDFEKGDGAGLSWVINIDPSGYPALAVAEWSVTNVVAITHNNPLEAGWNHICFTISQSFNAIYLNGVATTGSLPTMDLINNIIQIGFQSRDGLYFDGEIDEVGIWDQLLSQSDVTALYNSGSAKPYPFN